MRNRIVNLLMIMTLALQPFTSGAQGQQHLIINEIMQGNIDFILEANEFPDSWVELYNPTDEDINFNGYGLGLKKKDVYYFDYDTIVPSRGFLVVYCDKEAYNLHTDFRLDAGSGSLYLMAPDGSVLDQLSHKKQLAPNIAYGRSSDGAKDWGHELLPTPGAPNQGGLSSFLLPEPDFSVPGGVYLPQDSPSLKVSVSIPSAVALPEDTRLCITTDGREPTQDDAVLGESGEGSEVSPVLSFEVDVDSSMVIRAKLISSQAHSPRSTTHSYILHPRQTDLTVISIATNPDYLYDDIIGIFARGLGEEPNYQMDLRRPVNIEYFDADRGYQCTVNQCGEIKVQGNWSTRFPQKSFNVYAQKRFGAKRFDATNFWKDKPNVVECKSFTLRNGGSDCESARVRDQLSQTLLGRSVPQTDWQANREVICYINGQYKGVFDMRERADDHYIAANYQGLEDIDLIDGWSDVRCGDVNFEENAAQAGALSSFEELCAWTDIEQFINMYILEAFVSNTDFISNNIVAWRPWLGDGRWHWILKDLDRSAVSWIDVEYDYFDFVRAYRGEGYRQWYHDVSNIFNLVLDTEEGCQYMADHMAVAMGDWLQEDYMNQILDELCHELEPEYLYTLQEYYPQNYQERYQEWKRQTEYIRQWWPKRTDYVYHQMLPHYCLSAEDSTTYALEVNPYGKDLRLNGVTVYRPSFKGRYYPCRALTLSTQEENKGWQVEITRKDGSVEEFIIESNEYTLPGDDSYQSVRVWICDVTGIEDVAQDNDGSNSQGVHDQIQYYNLQGLPISKPHKGQMVIEKRAGKARKIIFK